MKEINRFWVAHSMFMICYSAVLVGKGNGLGAAAFYVIGVMVYVIYGNDKEAK